VDDTWMLSPDNNPHVELRQPDQFGQVSQSGLTDLERFAERSQALRKDVPGRGRV